MLNLNRILSVFAGFAAIAFFTPSAGAAPVFAAYLSDGACYQRFYEPAHLRSHPRQTVTKFHVKADGSDGASKGRRFTVHFGYWVKNRGAYGALAECESQGSGALCQVEADGGSFRISPNGDGLKITLGDRLEVEGDSDFSPDLAKGDNRVMLLPVAERGHVCR